MIKNVILFFLAICFMLLILSYILNINQLKLWNSSMVEGMNDINSVLAKNTQGRVSSKTINAIENTLALNNGTSGVLPTNIIQNLMSLNVNDDGFQAILKDKDMTDVVKLVKLKEYLEMVLKPKLSADGLFLHYPLDEMHGSKMWNMADETYDETEYDGIVHGYTYVDRSDYKCGNGSTRFRYDSSQAGNQRDYIQIPKISPTFYDEGDIFQGFTFATWFINTSNSKPWSRLFEFSANGRGCDHTILASVAFGESTNYVFMVCNPSNNEFNVSMTQDPLPINEWIHVATTISKNGTYINYINGVETKSNYSTSKTGFGLDGKPIDTKSIVWLTDPDTKASRVPGNVERNVNYIGKSVWNNWDGGFDGRMNDFRMYRKTLSAADILKVYNLKNPEVKYTFNNLTIQINAKRENVDRNSDGTVHSFKDASNKHNTSYPRGTIDYCPSKQVVTIPVGQHLEISKNIEDKPFTMAIVINVYDFKSWSFKDNHYGYNFIIGGGGSCKTFEMFCHANWIYINTSCTGTHMYHNVSNMKGDSVNIYIVKIDSTRKLTLSINGTICINNTQMPAHDKWESGNISIGKGPNRYSENPIDFYELMHFDDFYSLDKHQYVEGYLAKKWGLNVLPNNHPYKKM